MRHHVTLDCPRLWAMKVSLAVIQARRLKVQALKSQREAQNVVARAHFTFFTSSIFEF